MPITNKLLSFIRFFLNPAKLWFRFLLSLLTLKKKFQIFSLEGWHLGQDLEQRKIHYANLLENQTKTKVVHINFQSNNMIRFFLIYLKIRGLYNFSRKDLIGKKVKNHLIKFEEAYWKSKWDISLREENFFKEKILTNDRNIYKNYYKDFKKKIKGDEIKLRLKLFLNKCIDNIFPFAEGYEEWSWTILASKYCAKTIYLESECGLICNKHTTKQDYSKRLSNYYLNISKTLSDDDLLEAEKNLSNRVNGSYSSTHMHYMTREDLVIRDDYKLKFKKDNAIILFLHAFVDAPNKRINRDYNFLDAYDAALFIIDFCTKNKIPLYVKPHPNRYDFTSEFKFIASIKNAIEVMRSRENSYVEFIDGTFHQKELYKFKNLVAVTGRGSVSAECGFMKIPIINLLPEFYDFSFCFNLNDPSEMMNIYNYCKNLSNKENIRNDAIIFEAIKEKIAKNHIFEYETISKLTKSQRNLKNALLKEVIYI
ncbi:hypothetical protein N9N31_02835 [Candidatus Pelagibacter bacterium]|nr:hypothetical protein [Candidatus Pelagibacter bacterium]MDA8835241.1 hypothetical protein [Candidatus Pelagibacter bacterium]